MSCNGLPADTYDRYVLGLLDDQERSAIEKEIQQQCASCLRGVQRSMNLWLVYATTLDNAEPTADFRARLIRIAELSKRVLTFPKPQRSLNEPRVIVSTLLLVCCALGILLVLTWISGRYAGRMDSARSAAAFVQLDQENARHKLDLEQERERNRMLGQKETSASSLRMAQQQKQMKDQLSKASAEIQQLNSKLNYQIGLRNEDSSLTNALSQPGVKLLQLKATEVVASTSGAPVAYALIIESSKEAARKHSRFVFVGSNLPPPAADKRFQIWLLRKEEPKYVSAGLVNIESDKRAVVFFDAGAASMSGIYAVEVTEEGVLGSEKPSGPKILESTAAASTPS